MSLRKLSESQWNLLMAHYGEPETREQWGGTVPNSFEAASANAARAPPDRHRHGTRHGP